MTFNGAQFFRNVLLAEILLNTTSKIPFIFFPKWLLSNLVKDPPQTTPTTELVTRLVGVAIVALVIPIALSYPDDPNLQATARRRLTYTTAAAIEVGFSTVLLTQYLIGGSGLTDAALLGGAAAFGGLVVIRACFLFVRPEWMEAQDSRRKVD